MTYPYRLLAPGPVPMPPEVYKVMAEPILHHRTPAFEQILAQSYEDLKDVFQTAEPVLILTSTGSGAMEAAVVNVINEGDKVLCVVGGKFGERWADMCKKYGANVTTYALNWGEKLNLADFEHKIKTEGPFKAILTQVCETSTATLFPVQEMSAIAKKNNPSCLVLVDAITAIGVTPVNMDKDSLDVVVAGSQKAFMIPTGLSFIALSQLAWDAYKNNKQKKYYFDLGLELKSLKTKQTYYSSSVQLVRALNAALPRMIKLNRADMIARTERLMTATHAAVNALGLKIYSQSPSPSVTAIQMPETINSEEIRDQLESKFNVTIMGGQDHLKGKILRVGHLGYIKNEDLIFLIKSLGEILIQKNFALKPDQVAAACEICKQKLGKDIL